MIIFNGIHLIIKVTGSVYPGLLKAGLDEEPWVFEMPHSLNLDGQ